MDHLSRLGDESSGDVQVVELPSAVSSRWTRFIVPLSLVAAVLAGAACGGSGDGNDVVLSEAGARGRAIAASNGCAGCHGADGQGGVGPTWVGLYGSTVELQDGTTVIADDDYLARAISDPGAEKVEGASVAMPSNGLTDEEVADVIAYIRDLSVTAAPANSTDAAG